MKERIESLLRKLGVQVAGTYTDPLRWAVSDLAKDLADAVGGEPGNYCDSCKRPIDVVQHGPGGVMYANDPEGISHTNHCECIRCERARTPVDATPHVVQG